MNGIPPKEQIRQSFLAERRALSPERQAAAAQATCRLFFEHVTVADGAIVAGYWPIRGEVDTRPILKRIQRPALPCVVAEGLPLIFRAWDYNAPLRMGSYGIAEPTGDEAEPDIILAPLVAFDAQKNRLGYGGGYYDRTVAALRSRGNILAVGVAYEEQLCAEGLPVTQNDVTMDMIITDKKVYR